MKISTFTFKGFDIDVTYNNGYVAYTFVHEGETYGGKVKPDSKKHIDLISASFNLFINVIETHQAICKQKTLKKN